MSVEQLTISPNNSMKFVGELFDMNIWENKDLPENTVVGLTTATGNTSDDNVYRNPEWNTVNTPININPYYPPLTIQPYPTTIPAIPNVWEEAPQRDNEIYSKTYKVSVLPVFRKGYKVSLKKGKLSKVNESFDREKPLVVSFVIKDHDTGEFYYVFLPMDNQDLEGAEIVKEDRLKVWIELPVDPNREIMKDIMGDI